MVVRIDAAGTAAWYLADRQGSMRDVAAFAGTTVLDHLAYDAYGKVTSGEQPGQRRRLRLRRLPPRRGDRLRPDVASVTTTRRRAS